MRRLVTCGLFLTVASTIATAQRTWIVDAANGPGTDFRDLPAAFLRVADGDTLLVRKGNYKTFKTSKAVRLLGVPGVRVLGTNSLDGGITISSIPAGKTFTLKNVSISGSSFLIGGGLITIQDCAGHVVLDNVEATDPKTTAPGPALNLRRAKAVTLNNSRCITGLTATDCTLMATGSVFTGRNAQVSFPFPISGTPAIAAVSSTLVLGQCVAQGGNGLDRQINGLAASPATRTVGGALVIAGDNNSSFQAGRIGVQQAAIPAVQGSSGNLLIDPSVTLVPFGNGPAFDGFTLTSRRRLASLTATGVAPGGTLRSELFSPQGHTTVLFASLAANPVLVPALGQLWLDPGSLLLLDVGLQDRTEHRRVSTPIPPGASLRGTVLALQALSGFAPRFELSTAAHVVLH